MLNINHFKLYAYFDSIQLEGRLCLPSSCKKVVTMFFPGGSDGKASAYNAGDPGWEDLLEKETAPHSSILAWRIPWMEEPGRLQSMGLQRVGHD